MCENLWDLGACNKLNRRGMNCGHVGCGRTYLSQTRHSLACECGNTLQHFWLYLERANVQLRRPNTIWERTLCPPQI